VTTFTLSPAVVQVDAALLARFRAGDDQAFKSLHDRYAPALRAYIYRSMLRNPEDVEDVMQETFASAARAWRRNDYQTLAVRSWLYTAARNHVINLVRRPASRVRHADLDDHLHVPSLFGDPARALEVRQTLDDLFTDMRVLSERQRQTLVLGEFFGLSQQEVADALGTSVSSVTSSACRARSTVTSRRRSRLEAVGAVSIGPR